MKQLLDKRKETYVEKTPNDTYRDVAEATALTPEEVAAIGGVESQHGKFTKPIKGGSATGLFQFQPKTAEYLEKGSSDSLNNMNTQSSLMKKYLEKNKVETPEDAFIKHNLGPTRGRKFLEASDDDLVSDVIPENVIKANPGLYKVKTVKEAKDIIKQKLEKGKESSNIRPSFLDLLKEKK